MRFFNTAGPSVAGKHYLVDPLARLDLEEVRAMIDQQPSFVLHAPRQTGKTTSLLALMAYLNEDARCTPISNSPKPPAMTWRGGCGPL